ncbi:MAG: FAD-binding protein [Candidatus Thermoplasmatota archaeon]|nr:FAD-binding protein [Candidatus Thermoplasmatota archaeon]
MDILVLAKQIPEIDKIRFDASTGRIIRENVPLQMNSFDRKAVDEAIKIKEKHGGKVTVVSMGPPSADEILNLSLRMGADRAVLISDRAFAGSDTLVTSKVLAEFVRITSPDLVLAGKYSLDGETSQVPPEVAIFAGYNFKSSVSRIEIGEDLKSATVEHETEEGISVMEIPLRAVLSVSEKINRARAVKPGVPDMSQKIEHWSSSDLGISISGQSDSPTVVSGTEVIESTRNVHMTGSLKEAVETFLALSRERGTSSEPAMVDLDEYDPSRESVLGIGIDDATTTMEIASKIHELSSGKWNIRILGNIPPGDITGITCHTYDRIDCDSTRCMAEDISRFMAENHPKFVVFPSTVRGREVSAFVAALNNLGLTADCVDLSFEDGRLVQHKPAFGGGVVARITSRTVPALSTVRPGMFRVARTSRQFSHGEFRCAASHHDKVLDKIPVPEAYRPLRNAEIVISAGKGIGPKANMESILSVAGKLGAAVGATRPLVDFGYLPRQQQIGLTGSSISPRLYLAIGISGHDNHIVGIRYAGKIFAVNSNPDAPIFRYADFGFVGDSMEFLRSLSEALGE